MIIKQGCILPDTIINIRYKRDGVVNFGRLRPFLLLINCFLFLIFSSLFFLFLILLDKEEGCLFGIAHQHGVPANPGPITVMTVGGGERQKRHADS